MNRQPNNPGEPITTETSLTTSAHLGRGDPLPPMPTETIFSQSASESEPIYHSTFTIRDNMTPNTQLFELRTSKLFPQIQTSRVIPQNIDTFSTAVTMSTDVEVLFYPVKLPDSPCAIALDRMYGFPMSANTNADEQHLWSYTDTIQFQDGKGVVVRLQPQYNGIMPSVKRPAEPPTLTAYDPPEVLLRVRFLNFFVHTNIQPTEFSVLVFVRFTNMKSVGYSIDYTKQNYFLEQPE